MLCFWSYILFKQVEIIFRIKELKRESNTLAKQLFVLVLPFLDVL